MILTFCHFFVFSTDNLCCFHNWKGNNKYSQRKSHSFCWLANLFNCSSFIGYWNCFRFYGLLIFLWWIFLWIKPVLCLLWFPRIIARNAIMEIQGIHILKILDIYQFFFPFKSFQFIFWPVMNLLKKCIFIKSPRSTRHFTLFYLILPQFCEALTIPINRQRK